jgi:hypothetical protein
MSTGYRVLIIAGLLGLAGACGKTVEHLCVDEHDNPVTCPEDLLTQDTGEKPPPPADAGPSDATTPSPESCKGICGDANQKGTCGCDMQCLDFSDCCWDFATACADYINGGPSDVDAGPTTNDTSSGADVSTTPEYTFPTKFIPGDLSQKDCQGIASHNMTWCETTQCKGIAGWNYSWCDGHGDCKGIASKNYTYCDSKDCRGIAEAYKCVDTHKGDEEAIANCREQASNKYCQTKDCRGIAKDDFTWCHTAACKAIVKKDKSWCSQI